MASLGTPESPSIRSPIPGTSKGAQPHCPKKCGVSACYSVPLAHSYSNQDTQPPSIAPQSVLQLALTAGQTTPRRLDFADTPAQPIPRVPLVSPPANSYPPPTPHALLTICKPISHHTRSRAQAPVALFTSGRPYHKQVKYVPHPYCQSHLTS